MPVLKGDSRVRICGDYKVTVNRFARLDKYPIPRIEELFASLAGGQTFTKLDLSHAYLQIPSSSPICGVRKRSHRLSAVSLSGK